MMEIDKILRRAKIFQIDPGTILTLLQWKKHRRLCLPVLPENVRGATVSAVHFDFVRNAFLIKMYREDWPEVPAGQIPETVYDTIEFEVVEIPERQDPEALKAEFLEQARLFAERLLNAWPDKPRIEDVLNAWVSGYVSGGGRGFTSHFAAGVLEDMLNRMKMG